MLRKLARSSHYLGEETARALLVTRPEDVFPGYGRVKYRMPDERKRQGRKQENRRNCAISF